MRSYGWTFFRCGMAYDGCATWMTGTSPVMTLRAARCPLSYTQSIALQTRPMPGTLGPTVMTGLVPVIVVNRDRKSVEFHRSRSAPRFQRHPGTVVPCATTWMTGTSPVMTLRAAPLAPQLHPKHRTSNTSHAGNTEAPTVMTGLVPVIHVGPRSAGEQQF